MADTEQQIVTDVWKEKYRHGEEADWDATCQRVIEALTKGESKKFYHQALDAMRAREIVPAGRILAGAGTDKRVTLINCFTSPYIQDSMRTHEDRPGLGIMDALSVASYTQQMGGGIGMDFSTIRPRGAKVFRTDTVSSGVLPFMDMWDAMCATIRSAGDRRGAMMATLRCNHPDIEEFIEAKQTPGRLTNFNVSVLVTDEFMGAVRDDDEWDLVFDVPPEGVDNPYTETSHVQAEFVYKRTRARELWDKIVGATYVHAEPGVIFIDRVNQLNNLSYCETIHCCNPCGEQMLPDNGDCNLGHVNLAVMVDAPFWGHDSYFRWDKLSRAARIMVRLLDNVLDVTQWPTEEQAEEAQNKRRIGLGFTGLASALQQLGIRYGSDDAVEFTEAVARTIALAAYTESAELAKERGPFPLYDAERFIKAPFVSRLVNSAYTPPAGSVYHGFLRPDLDPGELEAGIREYGIRNGVLLSVAPTGTTSLVMGNVSSGIEPVFAHTYKRMVRGTEGEMSREYEVYDYGYLEWKRWCQREHYDREVDDVLPAGFVTADQLTVDQHLKMAAAAQTWIDSAVSKTINCPISMTFEEFKDVYKRAYGLGLKGCTTYRPDPRSGRGAVLSASESPHHVSTPPNVGVTYASGVSGGGGDEDLQRLHDWSEAFFGEPDILPGETFAGLDEGVPEGSRTAHLFTSFREALRPDPSDPNVLHLSLTGKADKIPMQDVVEGRRYRIEWPTEDCAYYVIITDVDDPAMPRGRRPFELFIATKSTRHEEWVKAFSLMATAIFRREGDPSFIVNELRTVFSAKGGGWIPVPGKVGRRHVPSLVAAVGLKIEEHLQHLGMLRMDEPLVEPRDDAVSHAADLERCEECGAFQVVHESGCSTCRACGHSDCG